MASSSLSLILLVPFCVSLASILILKSLAVRIDLVDMPDHRKTHDGHIPLVGGVAIFISAVITLLNFSFPGKDLIAFLIAAMLIVVTGLLDDHVELKVRYRLLMQFAVSMVITIGGGVTIESIGVYGGEPLQLGAFSLPFTVFCIMVAINAFNFMDGIDGLSSFLFLIAMVSIIMCLSPYAGNSGDFLMPLVFILAVVPFMAFNLGVLGKRNKIFLGDAGSMLLGLTAVWLLIRFSQGDDVIHFSPVTALWLIALPLMDMLSIVVRRAFNGRAPFHPDRNHLHHLFMDHGMSDRVALGVIGSAAIAFASIGVLSDTLGFPDGLMLLAFLVLFAGYYFLMDYLEKQVTTESESV